MELRGSLLENIAGIWAIVWLGVAVAFHFRLVAKLREAGREVSWWQQNQPSVWFDYWDLCREKDLSPWPGIAPILISVALAFPGWLFMMLRITAEP